MSRAEWVEERKERQRFALSSPRPETVFRNWAFDGLPPLVAVAKRALASRHSAPSARALQQAFADLPDGVPGTEATRRVHERSLVDLPAVPDDAAHREAWRIYELDRLGREVEDRERRTWQRPWAAHAQRDSEAAEVWAALFSGNPWGLRDRCEALWLGPAMRSFSGVATARDLPHDVRSRVLDDLREAFFYRLLGDGTSTPGWLEVAVRVLETVAPVVGPTHTLTRAGRAAAGNCVTRRAGWGNTTSALFPGLPDREGRASAFSELLTDPNNLEAVLDLHVVLRFLDTLPDDRSAAWRLASQNRGKARGRLRALVARESGWLPALLALDALQSRTEVAVARFAWSWAWQEMSRGFTFDAGRVTTPPCIDVSDTLATLADDAAAPLRTWVLLVVLKGRYPHLERWVRTGGTGDRDSTWARLLKDLPDRLLDGEPTARSVGYKRIRIHLNNRLGTYVQRGRVELEGVAGLPVDRKLKVRVLDLIEPGWCSEIPLPRSGFPTFVENARSALHLFEEDPCH